MPTETKTYGILPHMRIADIIIFREYEKACRKWPKFSGHVAGSSTSDIFAALSLLGEEYGEVCKAINESNHIKGIEELGHVAAVAKRSIELIQEYLDSSGVGNGRY